MENSKSLNELGSDEESSQQNQNKQEELPIREIDKTTAKPSIREDEDSTQIEQPEQIKHHDNIAPEVIIQKNNPATIRGQTENMNYGKEK